MRVFDSVFNKVRKNLLQNKTISVYYGFIVGKPFFGSL